MRTSQEWVSQDSEINPYIVFTDLTINLVLILMFFLAALAIVGQVGWEQVRYKDAQEQVRQAVRQTMPRENRPFEDMSRNDPPGVQRWVFPNRILFESDSLRLSPGGAAALAMFAEVLRSNGEWRRIRIEGHTKPTRAGEADEWELSAARSATVARVFTELGQIEPWFLAIAGRAGQNPLNPADPGDPANQRVEILLEYSSGLSFGKLRQDADPASSLPR
jgi:chemotaxis protein MotB